MWNSLNDGIMHLNNYEFFSFPCCIHDGLDLFLHPMKLIDFHSSLALGKRLILSESNSQTWRKFLRESPTRDDIINLLVILEEICQFHADETKPLVVDYMTVRCLASDGRIHSSLKRDFLTAEIFVKLPTDEKGMVPITALLSVITRSLTSKALYASLAMFSIGDPRSESILSIDALEDWLFKQSRRLLQIQKLTEQFLPLWVFTAAHTISFFHGRQKPTKISGAPVPGSLRVSNLSTSIRIRDFVSSETMKWLLRLSKAYDEDIDSNPFSRIRAVRYYDSFTVFDAGRGSCIPEHLCIFSNGYMNPVFMEKLLTAHGGPPLDYRRFLNFAIAWDNRKTLPGVRYFWPVLDQGNKGYISRSDIEELVKGTMSVLQCLPAACGPQGPHASEILIEEILDIFKSYTSCQSEKIATFAQALAAPAAFGTVVGVLGNTQAFIEYECREDTAHKNFLSKQMKESKSERLKGSEWTRPGQLALLQQAVDDCWFPKFAIDSEINKFESFAEFLDFHEATYGGESMEPWLNKYYQWEQQEAEASQQIQLLDPGVPLRE